MSRIDYPEPIKDLILHLKRLPGVGPRSAERVALWLHGEPTAFSESLATALIQAKERVGTCRRCGFYATPEGCAVCEDSLRQTDVVCVVESPTDVLALERTGAYKGQYHVLGGKLSPLHQIGPEDLTIEGLRERLDQESFQEIILALANDVEGEATANYLADLLRSNNLPITRLAQGLPAGGGLGHADELTLFRALSGRTRVGM